MAEEKELTGWERSRAAQKGYGNFYAGLAIATVFIAGVWIGSRIFATPNDPNSSGFFLNLWTEALGILVTVGLFGLISQWLAENRYKRQLVDEAASKSNEIAKHAVHMMRRRGWLEGRNGILSGESLKYACLEEAALQNANLLRINLTDAILQKANLHQSNLQEAILDESNLTEARLSHACLQHSRSFHANMTRAQLGFADLRYANLRGANLEEANMIGAKLQGAKFRNANFKNAKIDCDSFDETTELPNSHLWTPDIDFEQFTNPNHPQFWRSEDPTSPAHPIAISLNEYGDE